MTQGYEQRIKELVDNIPGALCASLTGTDGIGITFYQSGLDLDPTLADAEFATMLSASRRAVENLSLGSISEQTIATEKLTILIKLVGTDFYLGVVMQQGAGNLGMARLLLRRASEEFKNILY
jgi:predicted regulator of Ras-like GTPase activity (Roadblock/LC7/MglB family)